MKKPWLAALLNVIIPGVGYLYLKVRTVFAWLLIVASVLGFIAGLDQTTTNAILVAYNSPFFLIATLVMIVAFAVDAYHEAGEINKKAGKK